MEMMDPVEVIDNREQHRFEVNIDGSTAHLEYRLWSNFISLIHTHVPGALEGRGIGGALARTGLEYAREHGIKVVPLCPFVRSYLERHPEYQDLVWKKEDRESQPGGSGGRSG
jgi:predicted GNAT family acetyltransferase